MKICMFGRTLMFVCFFFAILSATNAADTLKINQTIRNLLTKTGQPYKRITIKQQFYTLDDTLFREINYSDSTGNISSYIFYFYKEGKIYTQEHHGSNDSVLHILKHEYDKYGNEVILTKLVPKSGSLIVIEKTINTYNNNRKILKQKTLYGKRTGMIKLYTYNEKGILLREKYSYKSAAKALVKEKVNDYSYTANDKISKIITTAKDFSGNSWQTIEEYEYNDKGQLSLLKIIDKNNSLAGKKQFKYDSSGNIIVCEEYDASGNLRLLLHYEYKKHAMDRGIQVSKYENL
jgi:hypothetical protein